MSKSIQLKLNSAPDEVVARAKTAASHHGVRFVGDEQTGHFEGHGIEGSYWIVEDMISIRILKKPFIIPWSLIEAKVRDYFRTA